MKYQTTRLSCLVLLLSFLFFSCGDEKKVVYDIVIYGTTSGEITASIILAKRMRKSELPIEPGSRIWCLNTGGIGQADISNKSVNEAFSVSFLKG